MKNKVSKLITVGVSALMLTIAVVPAAFAANPSDAAPSQQEYAMRGQDQFWAKNGQHSPRFNGQNRQNGQSAQRRGNHRPEFGQRAPDFSKMSVQEVKDHMLERLQERESRLTDRLEHIKSVIEKVKNAQSVEDLLKLRHSGRQR